MNKRKRGDTTTRLISMGTLPPFPLFIVLLSCTCFCYICRQIRFTSDLRLLKLMPAKWKLLGRFVDAPGCF
jgi:hypothetical protein